MLSDLIEFHNVLEYESNINLVGAGEASLDYNWLIFQKEGGVTTVRRAFWNRVPRSALGTRSRLSTAHSYNIVTSNQHLTIIIS